MPESNHNSDSYEFFLHSNRNCPQALYFRLVFDYGTIRMLSENFHCQSNKTCQEKSNQRVNQNLGKF